MVIKIKIREPWTLHPQAIKLPIDSNDCIYYDTNGPTANGQEILDAIGIARKEVCFVRVNKGEKYLSRVFVERDFNDNDFLDIYPFVIAG
ncbi:MAG: hypothetical protein ACOX7H_08750 [Bacillota bacterium]|jgi:hypothetical protein